MNYEDVMKLLEAGFDKDFIQGLEAGKAIKEEDATLEEPAPDPDPKPEQPAPDPKPEAPDRYGELLEAMQKLTGAIHASNILNDDNKKVETPTAADVIAQIVSPKK